MQDQDRDAPKLVLPPACTCSVEQDEWIKRMRSRTGRLPDAERALVWRPRKARRTQADA